MLEGLAKLDPAASPRRAQRLATATQWVRRSALLQASSTLGRLATRLTASHFDETD
jgi:hypothetical protein